MARLRDHAVVFAFRIGLSWLVGRRWLVLTTGAPGTTEGPRAVLGYRWERGVLTVNAEEGAAWLAELDRRPVAMAQAAPGPLAVVATRVGGVVEMAPTGRPAPLPVVPDLVWAWAVPVAALLSARSYRRRRCQRGGGPRARRA